MAQPMKRSHDRLLLWRLTAEKSGLVDKQADAGYQAMALEKKWKMV